MLPDIHRPAISWADQCAQYQAKASNRDDGTMSIARSMQQVPGGEDQPSNRKGELTVYYDGSCPLCSAEIAHYRKFETSGRISFKDIFKVDVALEAQVDQSTLMSRFHVRRADGTLVSGAAAFVSIWSLLPFWRWVAFVAALPGATSLLEALYRLFLPVRSAISRLIRAVQRSRFLAI